MIRSFLMGFLSWRGIVTLLGLAALCTVIWFAGPFLVFGDMQPLVPAANRVTSIVLMLGGLFAYALIRLWLARRANARMIKSLLDTEGLASMADSGGIEEVAIIRERFEEALTTLRDTIFEGRKGNGYLFELPWYVIIGPPGAGKTTILKNSGLDFPLARKFGSDPVAGLGGTRHCDWWFTEQAVMIDTAGRYTTQESGNVVDRAAWRGFLDLLKAHRRRRPLNGIIIAISLSDILLQSEAERKRHVAALRSRLQELTQTFGIELPTYLLITKCDLIAGFTEFFDGLGEPQRAQVWGMTLPHDQNLNTKLAEIFDQGFRGLVERLEALMPERAHSERGLARRGRIFVFPKEFASLRRDIGSFVHEVFKPSRFEAHSKLRGVYFTSGTQEGTPIDRVLAAFGRSFGLSGSQRAPFSGQGKAFFVNRLLTDVVFEEQGLVGVDRKLERRLVMAQSAGYAVACALFLGFCTLWWGAASRSEARIAATAQAATVAQTRFAEMGQRPTLATILPALNAAEGLRDATGHADFFAWLDGLGLAATPALAPLADELRDKLLTDRLLPGVGSRVSERLNGLIQVGGDAETIRDLLRSYLMLGDPSRYDRATVLKTFREEAQLAFPVDRSKLADMNGHIEHLMGLLPRPMILDSRLVDYVRSRLTRTPRTEQVYARLLREAAQNQRLRPINLASVIGPGSLQIASTRSSEAVSVIPAAFTREGFYEFVLPRLPVLIREELGVDWVTGGDRASDGLVQTIAKEVMDRYVADYTRSWQAALANVALVPFGDLQRGLTAVQALAGGNSPLERLVGVVRTNTDLPLPGDQAAAAAGSASPIPAAPGGGLIAQAAGSAANAGVAAALGDAPWPGIAIGAPFKPLIELIAPPSGAQPQMARVRELFSGVYGALSNVANAPDPRQAAYQLVVSRKSSGPDPLAQLRADSALRPDPVRGVMREVANASWASVLGGGLGHVNEAWRRDVLPVCQGALDQRYPMFGDGRDEVSLRDFGDFFRPGGLMDDFFQKYLSPFVIDQRTGFAPAVVDGAALPLRSEALQQFARARAIRSAFFSGTGSAPSVKFSLRPSFLDPRLLRATMSIDGRDLVYRHEATRAYDLEWPTRSEASSVSVTLTDLSGKDTRIEKTGAWALFRLVDASNIAARGGADQFSITVNGEGGRRVSYQLRASSINNPFSLGVLRAFRCPDSL